jgi:hypothetical protein
MGAQITPFWLGGVRRLAASQAWIATGRAEMEQGVAV